MILWRPVGLREMALVFEADMRAFPPRLPEQPIFYPVLIEEYADQIARTWNTKQEPFAGYVLQMEIADDYAERFTPRTVGGSKHRELWVPAESLAEFNEHLMIPIEVRCAFFGSHYRGHVPEKFGLRGADAYKQIGVMIGTMDYSMFDFILEVSANMLTFFLNFPFWKAAGGERQGSTRFNSTAVSKVSGRPGPFRRDRRPWLRSRRGGTNMTLNLTESFDSVGAIRRLTSVSRHSGFER